MHRPPSILLVSGKSQPGFNIAPPLGLHQLHHYLTARGVGSEVLARDLMQPDGHIARTAEGAYDVVGFSVSHDNMAEELDVLWRFRAADRERGGGTTFVAGGQEAALNWRQWLDAGCDLVFLGFAEEALYQYCRSLPVIEGIDGIAYRRPDGEYVHTPAAPMNGDLFRRLFFTEVMANTVDFAAYWNTLRNGSADSTLGSSQFIFENVRLYTSSHCPRGCGFCSSQAFLPESQQQTAKIDMIPAADVAELVRMYVHRHGARAFLFSDDDFPVGNPRGLERLHDFCQLVIGDKQRGDIPAGVRFSCQARVLDFVEKRPGGYRVVRRDLMDLMGRAGFMSIGLGVETFSERLFRCPSVYKLGVTEADCRAVIDAMLDAGLVPQINVILGIPEYTPEELAHTMDSAVEYLLKGCDVAVSRELAAFPGAPIFKKNLYEMTTVPWTNPLDGGTIAIAGHFVPQDPLVAHVVREMNDAGACELERIVGEQGWEGKIVHKRVVGLATLIAVARLLGRGDLVEKFSGVLDGVIEG